MRIHAVRVVLRLDAFALAPQPLEMVDLQKPEQITTYLIQVGWIQRGQGESA